MSEVQRWLSGVGGAQCMECDQTTVVRDFGEQCDGGEPHWICRPCYVGIDDEEAADE